MVTFPESSSAGSLLFLCMFRTRNCRFAGSLFSSITYFFLCIVILSFLIHARYIQTKQTVSQSMLVYRLSFFWSYIFLFICCYIQYVACRLCSKTVSPALLEGLAYATLNEFSQISLIYWHAMIVGFYSTLGFQMLFLMSYVRNWVCNNPDGVYLKAIELFSSCLYFNYFIYILEWPFAPNTQN